MTLKAAVAGASGYVGGELLRIISQHPELAVGNLTAGENAGFKLSSFQPHLPALTETVLLETSASNLAGHDVVFLGLPHGNSAEIARELSAETLVIDCGADFRLQSQDEWKRYYASEHAGMWPYGLPELTLANGGKQRERLTGVRRIAVPGCNVTAVALAISPALTAGLIEANDLVANLSVGTSGAGRSSRAELSFSEMDGNARAYSVAGTHRHVPEILQNIELAAGKQGSVSFTPVLVPLSRGIIAVVHAKPSDSFSIGALRSVYKDAYGEEPFVDFMAGDRLPEVKHVVGGNGSEVWAGFDERANRVLFISTIDNLVKGTAGAAVQSMNLALGFSEQLGLSGIGVAP
jgi:N-acetyl-gamma-glutamyl-phosphate reductase